MKEALKEIAWMETLVYTIQEGGVQNSHIFMFVNIFCQLLCENEQMSPSWNFFLKGIPNYAYLFQK